MFINNDTLFLMTTKDIKWAKREHILKPESRGSTCMAFVTSEPINKTRVNLNDVSCFQHVLYLCFVNT